VVGAHVRLRDADGEHAPRIIPEPGEEPFLLAWPRRAVEQSPEHVRLGEDGRDADVVSGQLEHDLPEGRQVGAGAPVLS
jgi:hypothetical protein